VSKARIFEAVKHLDLDAVKALVDAKPALLTATDRQGRTLLHLACAADCAALGVPAAEASRMVNFLLDRGLDIDIPIGRDKVTPLFAAVARGRNPTLVRFLLKRGAQVRSAPGGGLFAAAWWNDVENLELLIRAGAQIDIVVGITPFLAAWCWQKFDAAKVLALSGANVNYRDSQGRTALYHGVDKEFDPALLSWLVKHGASPDTENRDGVSARLKASRKRDKKFFEALG
jgi:ankyrin repeat protein